MNILLTIKKGLRLADEQGINETIMKCVHAVDYLHKEIIYNDDIINEFVESEDQSDDILFCAYGEVSDLKRRKLAYQSFKLDRYNYDAILVILRTMNNNKDVLFLNEIFLNDAKKHLQDKGYFDELNIGIFWGKIETRPFMRLKHDYILNLIKEKRVNEAIKECEDCLLLSESDNLGIRYIYATLLAKIKQFNKVVDVYNDYEDSTLLMLIPLSVAYFYLGNIEEVKKIIDRIVSYYEQFVPIIFQYNYFSDQEIRKMDNQREYKLGSVEEIYIAVKDNEDIIFESIEYYQWLKNEYYHDKSLIKVDIFDIANVYLDYIKNNDLIYLYDYNDNEIYSVDSRKLFFSFDYFIPKNDTDRKYCLRIKHSIMIDNTLNDNIIKGMFVEMIVPEHVKKKFISDKTGNVLMKKFNNNLKAFDLLESFNEFVLEKCYSYAIIWCNYHRIDYDPIDFSSKEIIQ